MTEECNRNSINATGSSIIGNVSAVTIIGRYRQQVLYRKVNHPEAAKGLLRKAIDEGDRTTALGGQCQLRTMARVLIVSLALSR